ncbi:VAC14 homolog [Olea europaea subsp. europaea]|uniref:VAC14 homolog n=2 Tax=Olea europaea subsp. europaea TaxID=158383 RepID=A0A8S0Q8Y0_OLEEU|nr:VAC14 homolog [Olea europaea subsp. europaea]
MWLLKALYGLLMLLPQQSVAFKFLRTRLKTVPSFSGEQFKQISSGNFFLDANYIVGDGELNEDSRTIHNGINFASSLLKFEHVQQQHRRHSKMQSQYRNSSSSSTKEVQRLESEGSSTVPDMNRVPSRSLRRGPGQLQL